MSCVSSVAVVGYTKEGLYLHIQGMAVEGFGLLSNSAVAVSRICLLQSVLLTILFVPPPFSSELLSSSASVLVTLEISPYPLDWAQVHVDLF